MRGEQFSSKTLIGRPPGSPPHARGAVVAPSSCGGLGGITPACAGSSTCRNTPLWAAWDHPRMRGEQYIMHIGERGDRGSPPHARGAVSPPTDTGAPEGITPAYAGSRARLFWLSTTTRDHPRIRGEQNGGVGYSQSAAGSPPHTRGAEVSQQRKQRKHRITPAYAGSSIQSALSRHLDRDHPRIRGEQMKRLPAGTEE